MIRITYLNTKTQMPGALTFEIKFGWDFESAWETYRVYSDKPWIVTTGVWFA